MFPIIYVIKRRNINFPNANDYRNPVIAEIMKTMGYVNRFLKWANRIPNVYREYVLKQGAANINVENDDNCIGLLKHYHSLAPMAMEARKPIFLLKPAEGAIGAHFQAVNRSYEDFKKITNSILDKIFIGKNQV